MSTRTVRLDDDAEATLTALQKQTGLSISKVLKRGLETYATLAKDKVTEKPYEIYRRVEPGPGNNAVDSASSTKELAVMAIRKKYGR